MPGLPIFGLHPCRPPEPGAFSLYPRWRGCMILEAQQRCFSFRIILVAIVSQNSLVLVFMWYHTVIARYVAKWGITQMLSGVNKFTKKGHRRILGSCNLPEKVLLDMGYRNDSIAISRDMGPLRAWSPLCCGPTSLAGSNLLGLCLCLGPYRRQTRYSYPGHSYHSV